MVAQEVFE